MGKAEAFCTQCGSLIVIDDSKEKNTCLFCGGTVTTAKALELKTDPGTRTLLQKEAEQKAADAAKAKKEQQKQSGQKAVSTAPASGPKQTVVIRPIPLKIKLILIGILVGIVLVLSGIFVPTILNRNAKRDVISAQLTEKMPFTAQSYAFKFNDNHEFLIATNEDLDEGAAMEAYESYLGIYQAAYSISADKTQEKVTMKLYAANGLYSFDSKDGEILVSFTTATPTPTPTTAASSASSSSK